MKLPAIPILSDLDGTLIDSKASVVEAFRWWAELRGLSADIATRIPFGRTSTDCAALLAPHLEAAEEGRLLDDKQAELTNGVVALPGARDLLTTHSLLAIVTSCPKHLAEVRLKAARLPSPRVLATPECWTRGKPDPEPYLRGAAMLGVAAKDCIVLEDAPSGVESGLRAGMRVIAVLTSHSADQLPGATIHIPTLLSLPDAFANLRLD